MCLIFPSKIVGCKMNDKTLNKILEQDLEDDDEELVMEQVKDNGHSAKTKGQKRNSKRSRIELESSTEDSEYLDTMGIADKVSRDTAKIVDSIRRCFAKDPTRKMSRDVGNQIMDMVGGLSAIISKLITRNTYLKGVLEGTTKERESVMKAIDEGFLDKVGQKMQVPAFAQVAQSTPTQKIPAISGLPRSIPKLAKTVILKQAEERWRKR